MEADEENNPSSSGHADESFRKTNSTRNYHNFGGFGGIHHGFSNPSRLNRNHYPYPPVSRPPIGMSRFEDRGASESIVDSWPLRYSIPRRGAFDVFPEHRLEGDINDHPMTTPDQSRNPSVAEHDGPRELPAGYGFGMGGVGHPPNQSSLPSVRMNSYQNDGPLFRAHNSLNSFNSAFEPYINGRRPMRSPPRVNHPQPSLLNQQRPISLTPPNSPIPAPSSIISTSTIRPTLTIQEQRYSKYITIHNACLDASTSHLSTLRRHQRLSSRRHHPYSPPVSNHARERQATLMDNISVICTHMWRKARNDGMAPHRAEAETVRVMRDLYAWGEVVVRAFEGGVFEEDVDMDEESERWSDLGESQAVSIGKAAKRFCEALRDRRAWNLCDDVVRELRDMEEREMANEDSVGIL